MASETETDSPCVFPRTIPNTVLEDLCSRFLINIPDEERRDVVRLCFQIETAHWFYIDFYRQEHPELPASGLKDFTRIIFNKFPFLNKTGEDVDEIFDNWKKYKFSVPVYGAIIMNEACDKCLLVQPFLSRTSWGFPKGKVNKDEDEFDCAIREVLEETGFDITPYASPRDFLEHSIHDHQVRLYIVPGVPENTVFQPQTRGEIKSIQWFVVDYLPTNKKDTICKENLGINPNSFFMVYPFVKGLRRWIGTHSRSVPPKSMVEPREETSSPARKQLQKLLDKEEARLEQEKKKTATERRRKQQQEKFQLQHELNHPLRQHHQAHRQQLKEARGYQMPKQDHETTRSPVEHEQQPSPIKILQRSNTDPRETKPSRDYRNITPNRELRDQRVTQRSRDMNSLTPPYSESREQQTPSPLQRLFTGTLDTIQSPELYGPSPFSPIHRAPANSPYGKVSQPGVIYSSHLFDQRGPSSPQGGLNMQDDEKLDPTLKLRLLASQSVTQQSRKEAVQSTIEATPTSRFLFTAPAFTNFKFDRQAILVTLP